MEGDCLSCMKYLMFIFNFFIFVSSLPIFVFYFESINILAAENLCRP